MPKYDKTLHQALSEVEKYKQHKRKVTALKDAGKLFPVLTVLQGAYDKRINFNMPKGLPPMPEREEAIERVEVMHDKHYKNFAYFVNKQIHQWEREKAFTTLLETIPEEDVDVIVAMKDKDLTTVFPSLTREFVKEALPQLNL